MKKTYILFFLLMFSTAVLQAQKFVTLPSFAELTADNEVQGYAYRYNLGYLMPGASVKAVLEYPEFRQLSSVEIRALRAKGYEPAEKISPEVKLSTEVGSKIAEVSFLPFVKKGHKWFVLESCKISLQPSDQTVSPSVRLAAKVTESAMASTRYTESSVLSTGKWVKIGVKTEGIYQLTDAQLQKMGFSDLSRVKLYGYGGRPLSETFTFSGDDALIDDLCEVPLYRRSGSVLFFAEGTIRWNTDGSHLQNAFSTQSCYFLTEGDSPATFSTLAASATGASTMSTIKAHALYDNDAYCWYEGGRDFYDSQTISGTMQVRMSMPGIVSSANDENKATVVWDVASSNASASTTVSLSTADGTTLSNVRITPSNNDGESARGYRSTFTTDALNSETQTFRISSTETTARLNYIRVNYVQRLSAENPVAAFSPNVSGAVQLVVENADANTRVWQLQNASTALCELPSSLSGTTLTAYASDGKQRFVIVNTAGSYDSPQTIGSIENQNLHADRGIQYVVIVPSSGKLTEQAERLAAAHQQKDGWTTKIVPADQIYNEFSSGTPDATAYRRYMKMLYDRAQTDEERPKYLVLFGDCAWDNRAVTSDWRDLQTNDFLLSYERNDQEGYTDSGYSIGTLHSYVTDDYYGMLDDDEGSSLTTAKIDLGIGRFPCHDAATAKILVDNTIDYMENKRVGAWKNNMFVIADAGDENLHMTDADTIFNQTRRAAGNDFMLRRLYLDSYDIQQTAQGATYPLATERLKKLMQQGALIFNYNGHGSPDRLSHQFLIKKEDMAANVSTARPLWIYASCEITPYDQQIADLGRNALYNTEGGAVAVVCAARSVYANYNRSLNKGLVKYLFQKDAAGARITFGEALRRTKCELVSGSKVSTIGTDYTINKLKYVLLGDPGLQLAYPEDGITIDSINGKPVSSTSLTSLPTGGVVRFSGHVNADTKSLVGDETFSGTLTGTLFSHAETVTCKGYGNSRVDEKVYTDYTRVLYQGSVQVTNGQFTLNLMIPKSVSFSSEPALLSLYAVSSDGQTEYKGSNSRFCISGTADTENTDSVGPTVYVYLDTPDFPDGGVVGTSANFYASVSDSTSISIASGTLGHDLELIIDNDASNIIQLNDYFEFDFGSYASGSVEYALTDLTPGHHNLKFRVWDVFDNSTTASLNFVVREGGSPDFEVISTEDTPRESTNFITSFIRSAEGNVDVRTEVYNIAGVCVWSGSAAVESGEYASISWNLRDYGGSRVPTGIYLYRSKVNGKETKTKKMMIL